MLETALIISAIIIGLRASMEPGMILDWFPRIFGVRDVDQYTKSWHKPLFGCPGCMASVWGIPLFFLLKWADLHTLEPIALVFMLPMCVVFNFIFHRLS